MTERSKTKGSGPSPSKRAASGSPRPNASRGAVTAREAALDILTRVEKDRSYSNLLLGSTLEKLSLSRADAGLVTELVYGTIQRKNTLDYELQRFVKGGLVKLEPWVLSLLRMSFYQLLFLDRIPEHAVVSEAVNLTKRRGHTGISGMVNAVLRNAMRQKDKLLKWDGLPPVKRLSLAESHPEWLVKRYRDRLGEEAAQAVLAANNESPHASARVNRIKAEPELVRESLVSAGLEVRPSVLPVPGLVVESGGSLAKSDGFQQGTISIQDESSMLVAEALAPEPGMRVLDCCAAPGGKTAHLAELMLNRGEVVSCDVHPHKEALIQAQADRLGLDIVKTVISDARELGRLFPAESFDRILLDAPCSGIGVIRRKPELKWTKREEEIAELAKLQEELLEAVHGLLKPGGVLVYSTCTTEPEENIEQVERFVQHHPDFALQPFPELLQAGFARIQPSAGDGTGAVSGETRRPGEERLASLRTQVKAGALQLLPSDFGTDGFFIARLGKASNL
ncbi:16S rRNA (cytosine(967)-C(5))-methyltransferase RsmB [Gorillibacterium sp. CAU 1737]|uniref:16S rRNA (cytosine(967)-C(5))-methyltransferase RsmB n=1 Tax=Gorillibacterium sp. CAU 1737 TaxID=3140362 RepID=UPI00326121C7